MRVKSGDVVKLRDGRTVFVTDAADSDPDAYRWYSYRLGRDEDGNPIEEEYVADELPMESIFVGHPVDAVGLTVNEEVSVVSDMSEVVSILE